MKNQPLLQIKNLNLCYGHKKVLRDLSLDLYPGEILGIVGSSGGGKSTLLKAITGLLPSNAAISGGQLLWRGHNILTGSSRRSSLLGQEISMIFQDPAASLYLGQTIGAQICTMQRALGHKNDATVLQSAIQILAELDFTSPQSVLDSYPFQLSGGMNQRICIALALLLQPALLLADEPTSGLDVLTQQTILQQLALLPQSCNTALLIVSHNICALARIADKIAVLEAGQIIEAGPTAALLSAPQQIYTQKLLQSIPVFRKDFL